MNEAQHYRGYLQAFAAICLVLFGPLVALVWYFEPLVGGLTRVGGWSEHDYGWNLNQPQTDVAPNEISADAKILVVGDSFSRPNIWQSFFTATTGLKTVTYDFTMVCANRVADLILGSRRNTFTWVIFETVERYFDGRFRISCARSNTAIVEPLGAKPDANYAEFRTRSISDSKADVAWLAKTSMNTIRYLLNPGEDFENQVINAKLRTGAPFSNRVSDRILFYREDIEKNNLSEDDLNHAISEFSEIRDKLESMGARVLLVIIPDKSSAYQNYFDYSKYVSHRRDIRPELMRRAIRFVDLDSTFEKRIEEGFIDLYLPNDTHLSAGGYRLMAEEIANMVQARK